eukprot:4537822-Pyramimonas_sp.AAC.1
MHVQVTALPGLTQALLILCMQLDWPHFESSQSCLDIFVSTEGEQLLFGVPPDVSVDLQHHSTCNSTHAADTEAASELACDPSQLAQEGINFNQSHRAHLLGSTTRQQLTCADGGEQIMYSPRRVCLLLRTSISQYAFPDELTVPWHVNTHACIAQIEIVVSMFSEGV